MEIFSALLLLVSSSVQNLTDELTTSLKTCTPSFLEDSQSSLFLLEGPRGSIDLYHVSQGGEIHLTHIYDQSDKQALSSSFQKDSVCLSIKDVIELEDEKVLFISFEKLIGVDLSNQKVLGYEISEYAYDHLIRIADSPFVLSFQTGVGYSISYPAIFDLSGEKMVVHQFFDKHINNIMSSDPQMIVYDETLTGLYRDYQTYYEDINYQNRYSDQILFGASSFEWNGEYLTLYQMDELTLLEPPEFYDVSIYTHADFIPLIEEKKAFFVEQGLYDEVWCSYHVKYVSPSGALMECSAYQKGNSYIIEPGGPLVPSSSNY